MYNDKHKLVNTWFNWVKNVYMEQIKKSIDRVPCSDDFDFVISVPFVDRYRDCIKLGITLEKYNCTISDIGNTLENLKDEGYKFTNEYALLGGYNYSDIRDIIKSYGVKLTKDDCLVINGTLETISTDINMIIQAITVVNGVLK